jgi:acetolactate synthase regulatory subunit
LEKETAVQAYTSAFSRFEEIYRLIGWRGADDEDPMFDKPVLTESRDLLIESIFGIEAYQMSRFGEFSEQSRMLFELSRLPRLLIILVRIACRQIYVVGACGAKKTIKKRTFDAFTVVRVLAIVARTLKGFNITSLSMEKLLNQCYARQVLKQPSNSDVDTYHKQFDLIYDCMTALDFTRKFREIREPLCSLFYMRYKSDSIHILFEHVRIHEEATIGINCYPELHLEQNMDSIYHPDIFAIPYLQEFGQLNIEWTDCLDEHLKIYANRNSIRVFAHPTFFYNGIDLHQ